MTNAIVVPESFKTPIAPIFAGVDAGDDLSGGITGGYGLLKYRGKVWSIQYHGNIMNLMRDDGDGPRGSVDIVIVKANAQLSKTWYENGWDENNTNPPDCASANGIVPDQGVPKKQSAVCQTCPKNAWGSDPKGGKGKACGDHRRLAIVPLTDLRNELFGGPMLLRCPAASLADLAAFDSRYESMGYPYFSMAVKVGFDPQESFPKFTFQAIRPLSQNEGVVVMELRGSPETARVVSEGSAPVPAQVAPAGSPAFLEPVPANAIAPQVAVQPVAQPAAAVPVSQPAPVAAAPVVTPSGNGATPPAGGVRAPANPAAGGQGVPASGFGPVAAQPAPVTPAASAGGFGPAAAGGPTPAGGNVAQPAKPAVQMTGFGNVAPLPTQVTKPAQPDPASAAPVSPAVVTAFEGSIDDRLNALLGE